MIPLQRMASPGRHSRPAVVNLALAVTLACGAGQHTALAQAEAMSSVLDGAYTEEQALRGQALYYQHCLLCHGDTMAGVDKAPALAGPQFGSTWNGASLAALVARILAMPPEQPGSLSQQQGVDILSYLLWYNGLPLGSAPLATDQSTLTQMKFQTPGGQ